MVSQRNLRSTDVEIPTYGAGTVPAHLHRPLRCSPSLHTTYWRRDLALTYKALPTRELPLIGTNPFKLSDFRAAIIASVQPLIWWNLRLPAALDLFETIFPRLFFMSISRVSPPFVFCFDPR